MKRIKILIPILFWVAFNLNAQEVLKQGGQKTSGATTGQILKWNGSNWVPGDDLSGLSDVAVVADSTAFRAFSLTPIPKAVVMVDELRGGIFQECTDCTVDQYNIFTDALDRKWKRLFDEKTVSVTWYGAVPNDLVNDSLAIQLALNSPYNVFVKPGNYRVGQHTVRNPKEIFAKGATFQLVSGLSANTRVLTILGSNISVVGLKIIGKIAAQTSEFSHGIAVGKPTSDTSSVGVSNVRLTEITVQDVRGDGIIVTASGSALPYFCENITLDNITVNNCLRNGISVISARAVRITNVRVKQAGLFGMNLEPDISAQKGDGIFIAGFIGPSVAFGHHLAVNSGITFQDFQIDGSLYGSTPTYTIGFPYGMTGLNVRQVSNLTIRDGVVKNLGGYGLGIGNTTTDFSNVLVENVTFDSTTLNAYYSNAKMLDQTNDLSDSAFVFRNCVFNGRGYLGSVGAPTGLYEDCVFTGFDRFLLSARGGHNFDRCSISLDLTGAGDFSYDGFGGFKVKDSYISCNYLVRGQNTDNVLFELYNNDISYAATAYSSMGSAPGARFILQNNRINGSYIQSVGNGGTVFHDKVLATGSSASTIILPSILLHPKNVVNVINETEGRTVTIDPESTTTVNGTSTATSVSTMQLTNRSSAWHFKADGVGAVSNGITLVGSTAEQGGRYTHNTLLSGRHLYSLNQDSLSYLRFLYNTNGALFSTRNGATGIKILGDISSLPGTLADDESFIATSSSGSGGLVLGDGRLLIGSRKNNLIGFTTDRAQYDLLISNTNVTFYRTGGFENNIWNKNTGSGAGKYTNITDSGSPFYKETFTHSGRMWISDGGDVPLILGGSVSARPPLSLSDNGGFIVTSGGGTTGTVLQDYGRLVFGSRYGNPMHWVTSQMNNPKMSLWETGLSVGNGMVPARDSVDIVGTVRIEGIPAKTTETNVAVFNALGQMASGPIEPNDLAQQGAATGEVLKWNGSIWAPATDAGGAGAGDINQNGNSFGTGVVIGSNDNNTLAFETNGATKQTIGTDGSQTYVTSSGSNAANTFSTITSTHTATPGQGFGVQNVVVLEDDFNVNTTVSQDQIYWMQLDQTSNISEANRFIRLYKNGALADHTRFGYLFSNPSIQIGSGAIYSTNQISPVGSAFSIGGNSLGVNIAPSSGTVSMTTSNSSVGGFKLENTNATGTVQFGGNSSITSTSGTKNISSILQGFAPTSGTGILRQTVYEGTFNQTGGASGISGSIFINPTITAVANYRALEIAANGANVKGVYQTGTTATNNFAGKTYFGGTTTPTALLHFAAGTTTASTAPIKFTAGTNLSTPEAGAGEWDGTRFYLTQTTGPTRKTVAYLDDITNDGNGIYGGSGTVPNGTAATLINDFTLSGTDNVGGTPALRVVMAGSAADKGLQTWRPSTGTDSLKLTTDAGAYKLMGVGKSVDISSPVGASISTLNASVTLTPTTGVIGIYATDRADFTGTDLTFSTSSVGSTTAIMQPHIVTAADITVGMSTSEIVCVGQSGDINITLGFTPFSIIGGSHRIKITNSSPFKVNLIRTGSWNWRDTYGVASTTNKVIYSGQTVDLIWADVAGTDYWLIKQSENVTTGVQEETSTTVNFDGRSNVLYIPSTATTTTINLPEIVASAPTSTQVTVGAKFRIDVDRAVNVSIVRSGSADLIKAHNYPNTGDTSIQTTGGTMFSQNFTAVAPNLWIVN